MEQPTNHSNDIVINWHLTEGCNYSCKYCYAKWDTPIEKNAIWRKPEQTTQLLENIESYFRPHTRSLLSGQMSWDSVRLNLAGGEPLLVGDYLRQIIFDASRFDMRVSLISNMSLITHENLSWLAPKLSTLGLSVDALIHHTNLLIGRVDSKGKSLCLDRLVDKVAYARILNPSLEIKLNTVVNSHNWEASLGPMLQHLLPDRWKVLRALPATTDALTISAQQFDSFVQRHQAFKSIMTVEDNTCMVDSYLMIDPFGRFFQNSDCLGAGGYVYSAPILQVGVEEALRQISFSPEKYCARYKYAARAEVAA